MALIQQVNKGDIIVERVGGKNRMTPVRKVEINACSKPSVHINGNECYDWGTHVRLAQGDETVKDLKDVIDEEADDFPTDEDLRRAGEQSIEAWADRLVRV